jgi:hypothetical protein
MKARPFDLAVPGIGSVRVKLYHSCPEFACGVASGPGALARWWAERSPIGWVFLWDIDSLRARYPLEEAMGGLLDSLVPSPADLVDQAQADRYEGPQL